MRTALLAALVIALSAPAGAQSRGGRSHPSARSTDEVFRPSIGLPLPPIGLPLPPIGLPPGQLNVPPGTTARPERFGPERPARFDRRGNRGAVILYGSVYGWPYPYQYLPGTPEPSPPSPPPPPLPQSAIGRLRLDLPPGVDPQVYVDGYYAGLLSDANGGELTLDAGTHAIEMREAGYETLHVDVQIPVDRVITYRSGLKPIAPPPSPAIAVPPPPPPAPATIYMIPRCYVGNIPPSQALLPAGCDARDAVEFPPAR